MGGGPLQGRMRADGFAKVCTIGSKATALGLQALVADGTGLAFPLRLRAQRLVPSNSPQQDLLVVAGITVLVESALKGTDIPLLVCEASPCRTDQVALLPSHMCTCNKRKRL